MLKKKVFFLFIYLSAYSMNAQGDTISVMKYIQASKEFYNTNLDSAEVYANKAIEYSEKINFYKGVGYGHASLGIINEYRSEYANSILFNEKSKEFFIKGDLTKGIAISNQYLGIGYYYLSEYEKSLNYYFEALKSFEKLNFKEGIASVNNNIGVVYEARKNLLKALEYYTKSYLIKKELKINASSSLANIANIYCEQNDFEKGLVYYLKSDREKNEFSSKTGRANLYSNISSCYVELSEFSKAQSYILKAIKIDTSRNNLYGYSFDLQIYGDLEKARNNNQSALSKYLKSHEIAKSNNYLDLQISSTSKISELYSNIDNYKKAYEFHSELLLIKDKVHFQENKEAIANLEVVYETEKKIQKIGLLNSENQLLSKENELKDVTIEKERVMRFGLISGALLLLLVLFLLYKQFKVKAKTNILLNAKNKELEELNATKDKLFSIVAHDLKNPVSAFKTLTESMSKGFDKIPQEMLLKLIFQLRDSSTQLFDVLTNLLTWSNSQRDTITVNKVSVFPKIQVDEIIGMYELNYTAKSINILNELGENFKINTDKDILLTAFRNIIMNAIKFTPENGTIKIYKKDTSIVVEDNGIGVSETDMKKLFTITEDVSSIGDSTEKGTGIGLLLCKELLNKTDVDILIESELGKGTKVILIF
ncbi:MAG: tetratricopeptide repeat-containing sensor histidine kinase [Bacteroidetes bacterium]|nr:tetratricopeptide repeat-containing sensor histidine kinase [Bacteroidota bacterium]